MDDRNSPSPASSETASPTLDQVAQAAGVSTATVSRALNSPDKVAAGTRERVLKTIDQLGYTPHFGARFLASNRSYTIGAVIPSMANAMFASGLQAFEEVLSAAGYTLLVASSGYDAEREFRQVRALAANGASGMLLIGDARDTDTLDFLQRRGIPCVLSWCYRDQPTLSGRTKTAVASQQLAYAGFDNKAATAELTREVLRLGHRRIGLIGGRTRNNDRAQNRINGVVETIGHANIKARLTHQVEADYSLADGGNAFESMATSAHPPSVIICGNDVLAAGALLRANQLGIPVPEQISITGFDDLPLASVTNPPMTTISVPQVQMGQSAANVLLSMLDGEKSPINQKLPTELILRESLAAYPG